MLKTFNDIILYFWIEFQLNPLYGDRLDIVNAAVQLLLVILCDTSAIWHGQIWKFNVEKFTQNTLFYLTFLLEEDCSSSSSWWVQSTWSESCTHLARATFASPETIPLRHWTHHTETWCRSWHFTKLQSFRAFSRTPYLHIVRRGARHKNGPNCFNIDIRFIPWPPNSKRLHFSGFEANWIEILHGFELD